MGAHICSCACAPTRFNKPITASKALVFARRLPVVCDMARGGSFGWLSNNNFNVCTALIHPLHWLMHMNPRNTWPSLHCQPPSSYTYLIPHSPPPTHTRSLADAPTKVVRPQLAALYGCRKATSAFTTRTHACTPHLSRSLTHMLYVYLLRIHRAHVRKRLR